MDFINLRNDINKIGKNYSASIQKRKDKKTVVETKSVQASSLDALSSYGFASVKRTSLSNVIKTPEEKIKDLTNRLLNDENLKKFAIQDYLTPANIELAELLCYGKDEQGQEIFPDKSVIHFTLEELHEDNYDFALELLLGKDENGNDLFQDKSMVWGILYQVGQKKEMVDVIKNLEPEMLEEFNSIPAFRNLKVEIDESGNVVLPPEDEIVATVSDFVDKKLQIARQLCYGKDEAGYQLFPEKDKISRVLANSYDNDLSLLEFLALGRNQNGESLFSSFDKLNTIFVWSKDLKKPELISKILFGKDENGNDYFSDKKFATDVLYNFVELNHRLDGKPDDILAKKMAFFEKLCFAKNEDGKDIFTNKEVIPQIMPYTYWGRLDIVEELCLGKNEKGKELITDKTKIVDVLSELYKMSIGSPPEELLQQRFELAKHILNDIDSDFEKYHNLLECISCPNSQITAEEYEKLKSLCGLENLIKIEPSYYAGAASMIDWANIKDINEIEFANKKMFIRSLISQNIRLYPLAQAFGDVFPLLPKNKEEYCSLLQSLCKSIGIETNVLSSSEINEFNESIGLVSSYLGFMSDEEFNNLQIEQTYSKKDFINNVLNIVSDLEKNEKQKVFDYFGFELVPNDNTEIGYSILGYPVNLNNGKKLAKIENAQTQAVIEQLRQEVIKFSQENSIICSDKNLEADINKVLEFCPELRTQIDRVQHGKHEFDVFKHSLKVMQKIVQKSEFGQLSDSDKKVLLLASLLHDTTKLEGKQDICHASESAFDAFYITKKFNLSKEETNKLYTLIKFHEWLGSANSSSIKNEAERENIRKSLAYDLHYDNIFELSKILTEADLKAVQSNDGFFDDVKKIFDINSTEIGRFVTELKSSQPLLPVTKIPPASKIKEAITVVNEDGSTNLKGIYQDKNGMVIIKYNEVENDAWEKIGFPKDSVSRGIKPVNYQTHVDTGNIKFFAHGLDFAEQLQNFDAFALPDTDALLSVSYMERPESKYRLFRPQGVLLDVDTKYVHGGGNTDAGSGCKKSLDIFKKDYAYAGSERHRDREYVSNVIKSSLGFTDSEYIEFVKQNENKPISEIEPESCRKKIVEVFASISSATRGGGRSYNEMYITNPRVMGVFAYPTDKEVGEIMAFVEKQHEFLKKYALEEDLPFVVFGN